MSQSLALLKQALALGENELSRLKAGEVENSQALALERGNLIHMACERIPESMRESVREKLLRLRDQQKELSQEAKRMHSDIRENLRDTKQQATRFSGYARAVSPTPLASRFLNKKG